MLCVHRGVCVERCWTEERESWSGEATRYPAKRRLACVGWLRRGKISLYRINHSDHTPYILKHTHTVIGIEAERCSVLEKNQLDESSSSSPSKDQDTHHTHKATHACMHACIRARGSPGACASRRVENVKGSLCTSAHARCARAPGGSTCLLRHTLSNPISVLDRY